MKDHFDRPILPNSIGSPPAPTKFTHQPYSPPTRHFDRSCSRLCEQRSGETRFSTQPYPSPKAVAVALAVAVAVVVVVVFVFCNCGLPNNHVISTEAAQHHRAAQWRDPRICFCLCSCRCTCCCLFVLSTHPKRSGAPFVTASSSRMGMEICLRPPPQTQSTRRYFRFAFALAAR
jgi:hypothetical protein